MYEEILITAVMGVGYAITGYANRRGNEKWRWDKIGKTVVFSAVLGAAAGYVGKDYSAFANSSAATLITATLEQAWKGLKKRFK